MLEITGQKQIVLPELRMPQDPEEDGTHHHHQTLCIYKQLKQPVDKPQYLLPVAVVPTCQSKNQAVTAKERNTNKGVS